MWLVIGYGSSLHSDDSFGRVVAERLRGACVQELEILDGAQLAPEWIEPISRSCGVIFVDASADLRPGQMSCLPLEIDRAPTNNSFSHHCTPESLVQAARDLYGQAPPAWLYLVGGEDFRLGETLSPTVSTLVVPMLAQIMERVSKNVLNAPFI